MRRSLASKLSTCLCVIALSACNITQADTQAQLVGRFSWSLEGENFGGFSGLEVDASGTGFTAITDRGRIVSGQFERHNGAISGVDAGALVPLHDVRGRVLKSPRTDSEGLALSPDGSFYVSFEGIHRVWHFQSPQQAAPLAKHLRFNTFRPNAGLETLAIAPDGTLYAIPERSGRADWPFDIYRYRNGAWDIPFALPRAAGMLPVGADFGPDGRFYVLEREFTGIGFRSQVRRMSLDDTRLSGLEVVLRTRVGQFDNLEGLSVWRDAEGNTRLTMISDDNFRFFQKTEIIEFSLQD